MNYYYPSEKISQEMNKVNHKNKIFLALLLLLSLYCIDTRIRIHPDNAGIQYSETRFYDKILPKLSGKSVMIISNPSGIGKNPEKIIKEFSRHSVAIRFFLGLEHGFLGLDEQFSRVPVTVDPIFNLPVYHIYKLKEAEIRDLISRVDYVLLDVQDMGMRCYTYITVLKRIMDQMHGNRELIILDHINPGMLYKPMGELVEERFVNFAADFPLPMVTGLSIGESALFYNKEYLAGRVKVKVIKTGGYSRRKSYEQAGLTWSTPSPNLPVLDSARNYFSLVLLEGVNVSVGRGTQAPFIYFGAPWMNGHRIIGELNRLGAGKVYFQPVFFKPAFGPYANKICRGLRMNVVDSSYDPVAMSYAIIQVLKKNFPASFAWEGGGLKRIDQLWGTSRFRNAIDQGKSFAEFHSTYREVEKSSYKKVRKYYLY